MKVLEEKLSEVKKHQVANGHPEEFIGETESEDESLNDQLELNSELDARLSRLALLDKTQAEINQISVATETMLQQSKILDFKVFCWSKMIYNGVQSNPPFYQFMM